MMAMVVPGILYTEGCTDIAILKEWARILEHPAYDLLTTQLFCKPTVWEIRDGSPGIKARDHYQALTMVKNIPGLVLLDGDDLPVINETEITGQGLQRVRWRRYEIESYLIHPAALKRFIVSQVGESASGPHVEEMEKYLTDNFPPAVLRGLGITVFEYDKAEQTSAADFGCWASRFPYTRYQEIAAVMFPEEIHPEVREKLDAICLAFNIPL
jgi:hypothetical protein